MTERLPRSLCVGYGGVAFCSALLHNIFLLYHVNIFITVYRIDQLSFWLGETAFLVWNSVNDPLFGWISDRRYVSKGSSCRVVNDRADMLRRAGPLLALAFASFWWPWTNTAVQFVVCLCIYDACLTMVDLHHSALLADLAVQSSERTRLNWYASIGSSCGTVSVFVVYAVWTRGGFPAFQLFCFIITVTAFVGFVISTRQLSAMCRTLPQVHECYTELSKENGHNMEVSQKKSKIRTYIGQLAGHRNFMWFAIMNIIQVFHCHFNSNFFPLFLENLLGDSVSQATCSLILGLSFVAPHINNLYFLRLCGTYGAYAVIRGLFYVKLGLAVFMFYMGHHHIWLLCVFIASNRIFTEGTCRLLSLVISDMVDEDYVLHGRHRALSALMFGSVAFLSKPGQTLAPLIGTWLLSYQTGHNVFQSVDSIRSRQALFIDEPDGADRYRSGIFQLLVFVPIACAMLQLLAWSRFMLHGARLQWVKALREDKHSVCVC